MTSPLALSASIVGQVLYPIGLVFFLLLIGRLVFEYVRMFARDFAPTGALLVVVESIYTVTDPPVRLFRRIVPPLRIGNVALDLGFMVLLLLMSILVFSILPRL